MKSMKKTREALKPLPYGGDPLPGQPTPEEIARMTAAMPGKPASSAKDGQRRARLQTHGRSYRTHRDG
jgi:hypothetical protein